MMNDHQQIADLIPQYVAGALDRNQRLAVESHLSACAECQDDLILWQSVSAEIVAADQPVAAPSGLVDRVLVQVQQAHQKTFPGQSVAYSKRLGGLWLLLRAQAPLVQREIWPASALVIGLGYIAALVSAHSGFVYALAPLIAAACVSLIYGMENDPGFELTLSTPTSPRQILLARLVLVFGYNLVLVLVATLGLIPLLRDQLMGMLVLSWLAPMTFLSVAALVLSLSIGAQNAISITYIAWLVQLLSGPLRAMQGVGSFSPAVMRVLTVYQNFWQTPMLLFGFSAVLLCLAVWLVGRQSNMVLKSA